MHGFEVVQPMFIKFDSSSNHESHRDVIPSSYLTHFHTQSFRKFSQVVIFKLSSCDLSPPLETVTGESTKLRKMSYTHPNSITSVAMGSMMQEEEMRKGPFWYFWSDRLWPFNFQPKIFNFKYLSFFSSNWKTEDSFGKLEIERRHGEKNHFDILSVSPLEILVTLQLPLGLISGPGPQRNFRNTGFHFFTQIYHFLSNPDQGDILAA